MKYSCSFIYQLLIICLLTETGIQVSDLLANLYGIGSKTVRQLLLHEIKNLRRLCKTVSGKNGRILVNRLMVYRKSLHTLIIKSGCKVKHCRAMGCHHAADSLVKIDSFVISDFIETSPAEFLRDITIHLVCIDIRVITVGL